MLLSDPSVASPEILTQPGDGISRGSHNLPHPAFLLGGKVNHPRASPRGSLASLHSCSEKEGHCWAPGRAHRNTTRLPERRFRFTVPSTVFNGREGMTSGARGGWSHDIYHQGAESMDAGVQLTSCSSLRDPTHGRMQPTFWCIFSPRLTNPIWKPLTDTLIALCF